MIDITKYTKGSLVSLGIRRFLPILRSACVGRSSSSRVVISEKQRRKCSQSLILPDSGEVYKPSGKYSHIAKGGDSDGGAGTETGI